MQRQPRIALNLSTVCLFVAIEAWATARISETTLDTGPTVVMENRFLRLAFQPDQGGTCTEFLCKSSGKRFVAPHTGSLLGTRVWNYTDRELYFQWERIPWEHEILRRSGEVELVMRAAGTVDFTRATTFEKRIVLRDGEAMLRVSYTFSVGQQLVNPPKIGLWFRNTSRAADCSSPTQKPGSWTSTARRLKGASWTTSSALYALTSIR